MVKQEDVWIGGKWGGVGTWLVRVRGKRDGGWCLWSRVVSRGGGQGV